MDFHRANQCPDGWDGGFDVYLLVLMVGGVGERGLLSRQGGVQECWEVIGGPQGFSLTSGGCYRPA